MAFRGRSLIPLSRSTSSQSRDLVPSRSHDVAPRQSHSPDHVHDYQQPNESRDMIPAPRMNWRAFSDEDRRREISSSPHQEIEVRSLDDDNRSYPESRHYPEDHHHPESYHDRRPPPSRYGISEWWDEDPRAAHPVNVNVYVENHNENHHEVEASGNSNDSWEKEALIAIALVGLVLFALILHS
jgi:hypothetical protein